MAARLPRCRSRNFPTRIFMKPKKKPLEFPSLEFRIKDLHSEIEALIDARDDAIAKTCPAFTSWAVVSGCCHAPRVNVCARRLRFSTRGSYEQSEQAPRRRIQGCLAR